MTTSIQTFESGLDVERHNALAARFNPFAEEMTGLLEAAKGIEVASSADVQSMATARQTRLGLRKIRVGIEGARKSLKESALREGKAIDGMANILKYLIVPVEEELKEKEDFVRLAEEARIAELIEARETELQALGMDCQHLDLGNMTDDAYGQLRGMAKAGNDARIKAEAEEAARVEAERIAAEQAELDRREAERKERERITAENEALRKESEAREAAAEAERKKEEAARAKLQAEHRKKEEAARKERAKLQEELRKKEEAERKERERVAEQERTDIAAEAARLKAEQAAEQARLAAPDADKMRALDASICSLQMPGVASEIARAALADVRAHLNAAVKALRDAVRSMAAGEGE